MNDRERLIELLKEVSCRYSSCDWDCGTCKNVELFDDELEMIADHLLANSVTTQRWIPVTERLPEKNTSVLVSTDNGIVFQCLYAYDGWDLWDGNEVNITHWQPMPQPPKEEA